MEISKRRPLILSVDDDKYITIQLKSMFKKLDVELVSFDNPADFLKELNKREPDLCLVDLNIDTAGVGFVVVQAIRKVLDPRIPIILLTSEGGQESISHGLEIGANDYVVKPIDTVNLIERVLPYLKKSQNEDHSRKQLKMIPVDLREIEMNLELRVKKVDELGLTLEGKFLLAKGTVIKASGPIWKLFTGSENPGVLCVCSSWVETSGRYCMYAEFEFEKEEYQQNVRKWLQSKTSS